MSSSKSCQQADRQTDLFGVGLQDLLFGLHQRFELGRLEVTVVDATDPTKEIDGNDCKRVQ